MISLGSVPEGRPLAREGGIAEAICVAFFEAALVLNKKPVMPLKHYRF